jgi:dUTP pyrophosphatase
VVAPSTRLRVLRLRPDAVLPRAMSEHAAGLDLSAALDAPQVIRAGERAAIPTGIALAIEAGFEGQVRPRSGLARRHGLTVLNAPGTIDADYRGEVVVLLVNLGGDDVVIEPGERIAQLVVAPVARAEVEEVSELDGSERGDGGFGSTGRRAARTARTER